MASRSRLFGASCRGRPFGLTYGRPSAAQKCSSHSCRTWEVSLSTLRNTTSKHHAKRPQKTWPFGWCPGVDLFMHPCTARAAPSPLWGHNEVAAHGCSISFQMKLYSSRPCASPCGQLAMRVVQTCSKQFCEPWMIL
jgi:hypothetical protein